MPRLPGQRRQPPKQRSPAQPSFDGKASTRIDALDRRGGDVQAAVDFGQKGLLTGEETDVGRIPKSAEDAAAIKREDFGLPAGVEEGIRPKAEFSENVGGKLARRRSAQLTVRCESGRSSEKAGIWIENISPCSFCIWYVPTMMPDAVVRGQPLV